MTEPGVVVVVVVVGSWELTRSIIHDCPALKMPQTWLQQLGATAQIVVLKGADDAAAAHILAALNATQQPSAPVPAVPLTNLQIADLATGIKPYPFDLVTVASDNLLAFARAIERAHGVTGAPDHG